MKDKLLDKFLWECKKSKVQTHTGHALHAHKVKELSPYADPNNWIPTRIVGLYQGTIHSTTFLGNFVELKFRDARRLETYNRRLGNFTGEQFQIQLELLARLPRSTEILPAFGREPSHRADTESEIRALTERFYELMGEFTLQNSGVL